MHLFLRRQRREVAVPVAAPTAGSAVLAVRAVPRRDVYAAAGLYWLKVRDDGRVACRTKPGYKQIPAYFRGRLDETAQGVMLRGTIRESRSEGFQTVMYAVAALAVAGVAVGLLAERPDRWAGPAGIAAGAALLGLIAWGLRRLRPRAFRQDADRLVAGLTELFAFRPGRPGADPEAPDGPAVRSAGRW